MLRQILKNSKDYLMLVFGPFYSSWGRCYFNYQKKKIIINFNETGHMINDKQKNFIKKIIKIDFL